MPHAAPQRESSTDAAAEEVHAGLSRSPLERMRALQSACGNRAFGRVMRAAVARSAQSDTVHALGARVELDTLLRTLNGMTDRSDGDVATELASLLSARPDDLWVAQRVWAGELGRSAQRRAIETHFFPGRTGRRALVIAGVHGTERQGIEVANLLMTDLRSAPADFSVILVPRLFPDNAERGAFGIREGGTPTNRNFPTADRDFAASGGRDAQRQAILPENEMLMHLMERYRPERIISLHGTQSPGQAGVFYDPRALTTAERTAVEDEAARSASAASRPRASDSEGSGEARQRELYQAGVRRGLDVKTAAVGAADRDLSIRAATMIDVDTAAITGRDARDVTREREGAVSQAQTDARHLHGSVAGNVGASGAIDTAFWAGSTPGGVSLGGYAAARGMSVFTVEPPVSRDIADYRRGGNRAGDRLSQADRRTELQAYADAVRTVLLME